MHKQLTIHLPREIEQYEPELRFFFDLMVRKLHTNRHKGFCEDKTTGPMYHALQDEVKELEEALKEDGSQFDVALECADIANQAWLLALVALRMTKEDFNNG